MIDNVKLLDTHYLTNLKIKDSFLTGSSNKNLFVTILFLEKFNKLYSQNYKNLSLIFWKINHWS